jgi:hypothetical protein
MVTFKMRSKKPKTWYSNRFNTIPPPILFKRSLWNKDAEGADTSTFKLRSNPSDKDSQIYELKARSFAAGTVEQFIFWKKDLDKIIKGQNVTRPKDKFEMARRLLHGDALAVFDKEALTLVQEDEDSFQKCLTAVALHIFPKNALSSQKAWLRHSDDVRKQPNMPTRTWTARLQEINQMLSEFPPAFSITQRLSDDDFVEIVEYGIPHSWRTKMAEHGFVPVNHTLIEMIEFCNKMEYAEEMTGKNVGQNDNRKTGQHAEADSESGERNTGAILHAKTPRRGTVPSKRRERHVSFAESDGKDGCALHNNATDHTTDECHVLLGQAKKMRSIWEAQPRDKNNTKCQKNDNNSNLVYKSNGDFHTLLETLERVKENVNKALRRQHTTTGKRKSRDLREENIDEENTKNIANDTFVDEIDQLSVSDDDVKCE